jgi:hypothetical protein
VGVEEKVIILVFMKFGTTSSFSESSESFSLCEKGIYSDEQVNGRENFMHKTEIYFLGQNPNPISPLQTFEAI